MSSGLELFFDTDIDSPSYGMCDLAFDAGNALESAVLMSLFCHARASDDDMLNQDSTSRFGYWGDRGERKLGSKLWLIAREKLTDDLIRRGKRYIEDALQWMVEDGLAVSFTVNFSRVPDNISAAKVRIFINRADGTQAAVKFDDLWSGYR